MTAKKIELHIIFSIHLIYSTILFKVPLVLTRKEAYLNKTTGNSIIAIDLHCESAAEVQNAGKNKAVDPLFFFLTIQVNSHFGGKP